MAGKGLLPFIVASAIAVHCRTGASQKKIAAGDFVVMTTRDLLRVCVDKPAPLLWEANQKQQKIYAIVREAMRAIAALKAGESITK